MKAIRDLLTVAEAAQVIGVCHSRIRQFCLAGRLGQKFGNAWVIERDEAERFKRIPRPSGRRKQRR